MEQPLSPAAEQSGTGRFLGWFPAPQRLPTGLTPHSEPGNVCAGRDEGGTGALPARVGFF